MAERTKREGAERTWGGRIAEWLAKVQFATYTTLILSLLTLAFLWPRVFISIPAGYHGVMYRFFTGGTVTDRVWNEGLKVIFPWDSLFLYETRLQQKVLHFDVLSEEGLTLDVSVSVRWRTRDDMLGHLHEDVGPDYFERLIKPEVESHVRRTFGSRPAHELYASTRDVIQELGRIPSLGKLDTGADGVSSRPYLQLQELKLLSLGLPEIVKGAIAEKYRQEQLMLEYRYKLESEEKEAERKRTEAAGIRDYNLIAGTISPDLLRWRGVDATLELAKSPNTKVVVLGGGQGSNPVLLNLVDGPNGPAATPTAPAPATSAAPTVRATPAAKTNDAAPAVVASSHGAPPNAPPAAP